MAYQAQARQTISRRAFLSTALTLAGGAALGLVLDSEAAAQDESPDEGDEPPP